MKKNDPAREQGYEPEPVVSQAQPNLLSTTTNAIRFSNYLRMSFNMSRHEHLK